MRISWITERCNEVLFGIKSGNDPLASLTSKELNQNLSEATRHGMLPVVMESLSGFKIDDPEKKKVVLKWYGASEQSKKNYWKRIDLMEQLALQFKNAGLDVMFLKGAALAQLYPKPVFRVFNDIDFYLYGNSTKGIEVMKQDGIDNKASYHHHTKAVHKGVLLENHYDFLERVNHKSDIVVDDELKCLASEEGKSYKADFLGDSITNAYVMTPTMNALFLMRHMMGHFASETIPLRMLYDWALFLKHDGDKVDWKRVITIYEKTGSSLFAGVIHAILRCYLNTDTSNCPIVEVNNHYTSKVWNSILNPPANNSYKEYSFCYFVVETKVFIANRWKYKLAYPDESYMLLLLQSAWSVLKRKLGLLKIKEE